MRRLGRVSAGLIASLAIAVPCAQGAGWQPGFDAARDFAQGRTSTVSFAFTSVNGREYGLAEKRRFYTASVIKPMLLAAYLHRSSVRRRSLTRDERRFLLGPMIRRSSNVDATEVNRIVGAGGVEGVVRRAGMPDFSYNPRWGHSLTSAREQADWYRSLDRAFPARHRRYARRLLGDIVERQRWGVAETVPDGWRLYFKGGWGIYDPSRRTKIDHQVALLEKGRCRVSMAILTEGNHTRRYAKATERGVAERLLRGIDRLDCSEKR